MIDMRLNSLSPGSNSQMLSLNTCYGYATEHFWWEVIIDSAWCCQAASHLLNQCWPWSMLPYGITRQHWMLHDKVMIWKHFHTNFCQGESTSHQRVPLAKGHWCRSLMFSLLMFKQAAEQTVELPVIRDKIILLWPLSWLRHLQKF